MNSYTRLPEDCKTINDIVTHAANKGMFRGCSVPEKKMSDSAQVINFSKYLAKWLNNNTNGKKYNALGINNGLFFINRLLGNHFPGKALISYNPDIAMAVTLMSITRHEITLDHVEGLIEKSKNFACSINKKFFDMELHFNFVWPPCDIGTFNRDTAGIVSDPVSPDVIEKLKISVSQPAEAEDHFLSPDETEVLDVLISMDVYSGDLSPDETEVLDVLSSMDVYSGDLSPDETEVLDILVSMDVHDSKKRMIEEPITFGGEGSAFKPYKKLCV
jgi:hypothetical protein